MESKMEEKKKELEEELSCPICLEIFFEPCTITCGHSFCKKCLDFAAVNCGYKCPKCRQRISYDRLCTVSTVLWNMTQLLFPQEVEARKAAGVLNNHEIASQSLTGGSDDAQNIEVSRRGMSSYRDVTTTRRREVVPGHEVEDAGLGSSLQSDISDPATTNFVPLAGFYRQQVDLHGLENLELRQARARINSLSAALSASRNPRDALLDQILREEMDRISWPVAFLSPLD